MRNDDAIKSMLVTDWRPLAELSDDELRVMAEAGQEVMNIHRVLSKTGANIVGELLKSVEKFFEWDHIPKGDVYDRETHAQYYYHAHVVDQRFKGEHGHFHTFMRPKGMPAGVKPAQVPGATMPDDPNNKLSHLVSVSMDPKGFPFRLFTVNRWVTGEVWYKAGDVIKLLDSFVIDHTWPSWPVNRWISAMLPLFRPQIVALVEARDRQVAAWVAEEKGEKHPYEKVFEDRAREVTSYLDINLETQIKAVGDEILRRD